MTEPYLPAKTAAEMQAAHPKGTRHASMIRIALPLIGSNWAPEAVFAQLRHTFPDEDKTDEEIWKVIRWCQSRNPTPCGFGNAPESRAGAPRPPARCHHPPPPPKPRLEPRAAAQQAIGKETKGAKWWLENSPIKIPDDPVEQTIALLTHLYGPEDHLNILWQFTPKSNGKLQPTGGGSTRSRDQWIELFTGKPPLDKEAGVWARPNPCKPGKGSGKRGGVVDADIADFRFALLESDSLSIDEQLSLYARTGLPIAAIITSGGESCHAWIRVDASTAEEYIERVKPLFEVLKNYGVDPGNKNPSRLSRLAGVYRQNGGVGDRLQRLLYLNPDAKGVDLTPELIARMAAALAKPPPPAEPLLESILDATSRYEELMRNRGRNGVFIGIESFDAMSGGLKPKRLYILAAESKAGKSSFALNIANFVAVDSARPVAIFSMEMDRDEIVDMLVSMRGGVDRNHFNTGDFKDYDLQRIVQVSSQLASAPIHIFDAPIQTIDSIRENALHLKASIDLSLIIVDYMQLVTPPMHIRESREQQVAAIGQGLRALCVEADAPVLALSQLNEDGKIRESRFAAHAAHGVLYLEEIHPDEQDGRRELRLRIERARQMPRGAYPIVFEPSICRMYQGTHSAFPSKNTDDAQYTRKTRNHQH